MAPRRAVSRLQSLHGSLWTSKAPIRPLLSRISSSSDYSMGGVTLHRDYSTSSTASIAATEVTPRIHILGLENLGKLFAHSLATLPTPPPITLLTHRPHLPNAFTSTGSTITLTRNNTPIPASNLTLELTSPSGPPIEHLIITTKAPSTADALAPFAPRLSPTSTLLFTQNGLGALPEVSTRIFPDPSTRPAYLSAIVVHGVFSTGPFAATHAGLADMKIGAADNGITNPSSPGSRYLLDAILASEPLAAKEVSSSELLYATLEKLVANTAINPLTALFRVRNGELLVPAVAPLRRALVYEASAVFLTHLSALGHVSPELSMRFSPQRLGELVMEVNEQTGLNRSSMLQDVEAGRGTEIAYINGWVVGRGEELGVEIATHREVVRLVKEGRVIGMGEVGECFPRIREFL